ncbi:hypothetical protein ABBQ32_001953 [Trebouxia sp. C0010 RCD-2024]
MSQTSDAKLEEYCLVAKGSKGRTVADVIQRATSDPVLFAFGELLSLPSVQQLQDTDQAASFRTLRLFAYGTWATYQNAQDQYPPLSAAQQLKLRQLTLVTMASASKNITYSELTTQLGISSIRELEDMIITECFYKGIVSGKLDQQKRCLQVTDSLGRDVKKDQLPEILQGLQLWLLSCQQVQADIDKKIKWAVDATDAQQKAQTDLDSKIAKLQQDLRTQSGTGNSMMIDGGDAGGAAAINLMEEDRVGMFGGRSKRRR